MRTTPHTLLRVPAEDRFLVLVRGHVREVARTVGFPARDVLALELAAEEAFLNICAHAYPDGTPGDMLVKGELLEGELRLEFLDEGLPFDPALLRRQPRRAESEAVGLGMKLIHHAVDEVRWVNHGRRGKALCLVKHLPRDDTPGGGSDAPFVQPAIHLDSATHANHAAIPSQASERSEASKTSEAPEQPLEIRPLQPEDALSVARLFWLTYGYSYNNEAFYRPEGLLDLLARGVLVSYVAVTRDGEVVGHAGLLRPEPVPMAEMALLVVSPAHRGRGLMSRFFSALTDRARESGLFGLALNPVTSHPVSQRNAINIGGRPCGLDLAACPPRQFKAMGLDDGPGHRESYLHCFLYLTGQAQGWAQGCAQGQAQAQALAFVPERHRRITERIYENLGRPLRPYIDPREMGEGSKESPAEEPSGVYTVSFDRGLLKGVVRISVADARQWPEILRAGTDLLDIAGAEVVHIDLPLTQRATARLCELAEAAGFFFAGVWPHGAPDGDMLRLSRLAAPLDMNLLRLHSDFAHELAEYVGAEMVRAIRSNGQAPG